MAASRKTPLQGEASVAEKRGRGRPCKPDAMTNAQRQAAYRARRKAAGSVVTVTKMATVCADGYDELVLECDRLREALAQARRSAASPSQHVTNNFVASGASRILAHRLPPDGLALDDRRLNLTVAGREFFSLERLAAHFRLSKREVIERLIWSADERVSQSFGNDDAAFNRYVEKVTKK